MGKMEMRQIKGEKTMNDEKINHENMEEEKNTSGTDGETLETGKTESDAVNTDHQDEPHKESESLSETAENLSVPALSEETAGSKESSASDWAQNESCLPLEDLALRRQKAEKITAGYIAAAGASAAIPVPFADAPVLIAEQCAMLASIGGVFDLNLTKHSLRTLVFSVLGISGTTLLGKTISGSLIKLIPGAGSAAGALVCGSTAAVLTGALGHAFISLCESVKLGDLEEEELLSKKGRKFLETQFRNNLRLEMKPSKEEKDVLKSTPVPHSETAILLPEKGKSSAQTDPADAPSSEPEENE